MRAHVQRAPFITYLVLVFVITWAVWVPRALADQGLVVGEFWTLVGSVWTYGPAIAAVAAAALVGGRTQLRELGSRLVRFRVGWRWYAAVLLGPAAAGLVVAGGAVTLGSTWDDVRPLGLQEGVATAVILLLMLSLTDGLGEEVGWRGYAQPRLEERLAWRPASLLLGVVWAAWHLPLFWTAGAPLEGTSVWLLFLRLPATALIFGWVYHRTRGSTLIAVLLHGALNLFGAPTFRAMVVQLVVHWLVAGAMIWSERDARAPRQRESSVDRTFAQRGSRADPRT